ncbi:MAG: hypothetical protein E7429_02620 [Ruminococcaceae bacterium]|nr:hypothetical protein [Oscillospiraceae bacterium]
MQWFFLIGVGLLLTVGAWFWGNASDPKKGGAMGCCHCGQCIVSGECVMRGNLQKKMQEKQAKETASS